MQLKNVLILATALFGAANSYEHIINFKNQTTLDAIQNDTPINCKVGDTVKLLIDENRSIPYLYYFNIPEGSASLLSIFSDEYKQ
jgi:hypothetical protein